MKKQTIVETQLYTQLGNQLSQKFWAQISREIRSQLAPKLRIQLCYLSQEVDDSISVHLYEAISRELHAQQRELK